MCTVRLLSLLFHLVFMSYTPLWLRLTFSFSLFLNFLLISMICEHFFSFFDFFLKVVRTPISSDVPHTSLTSQDGIGAAMAIVFGNDVYTCMDIYQYCYNWIVPPLTDPLLFFPPSPRWTGLTDVTADFQEKFVSSGLSQPTGNGNILYFVFAFSIENSSPITRDISKVKSSLLIVFKC